MDKKLDFNKFFTRKKKDYTYAIAFFLIFSFFSYFIIRPNLLSVFEANLRIQDLKKTNAFYETQIENIITAQSILIEARNDLEILDRAVTKKPQINELLHDITETALKKNLELDKLDLTNVNLKDIGYSDHLKTVIISTEALGGFNDYFESIKDWYNQIRLKLLKNIEITKREDKEATPSGKLKISFEIESYYL